MSEQKILRDPMVGKVLLDRYQIVELLGKGGMGAVYRARHISMDRMVALKLIHPAIAGSEQIVTRFHREMQAMSRIAHPNTVQVFDYGEAEGGQLFLAMELLDGQTLSAVLRKDGALPLERVVHIGGQILKALGAAHEEGIVHRDLKPDNVMLLKRYGEEDVVKVLDFGIARFLDAGEGAGEKMTAEGSLLGTPAYMSPEQALGQEVGPASDLYSLGVMLYQMAVGELPFSAPTLPRIILMHAQDAPRPPSTLRPVAGQLEALILQLLQKQPADRPQPALAVLQRLQACSPKALSTPPVKAPPPPEPPRPSAPPRPLAQPLWRRPGVLLAGAGLFTVGLWALALWWPGSVRAPRKEDLALQARLTELIGRQGDPPPPPHCMASGREAQRSLLQAAEFLATPEKDPTPALGAALERCPTWAVLHNLQGNALQRERRYPEADAAYRKALELVPGYVSPRHNLGLLALRRNDPQGAVLAADEVLRLAPQHPLAHLVRGQARLLLGDTARALGDIQEATRRQPERAQAWLLLGQALGKVGDTDTARRAFCKAKELGSDDGARLCSSSER